MTTGRDAIGLVRIIARLNIGGPAIQAISLTRLLGERGYQTRLVRGQESPHEGNMDYLARELGVVPTYVPSLRREPGPGDATALTRLVRIVRGDRPMIVHTHAAKAGTLGRLATVIAFPNRRRRPILVHTFHGHSLTGYFSGRANRLFLEIERRLARVTDVLVAVSPEVRDDLIRLRVAEPSRFEVIPLGFDFSRFADDSTRAESRAALRAEWGLSEDDQVVTLVARLVPIKRVDRFLRVARLLLDRPDTRFVVVGDGELRSELEASPDARALGERLVWAGFHRDMPAVYAASDVVVLTSDNEGTPVSLIEAQAAGLPVVGTDVGGVRSAIRDGETGFLAAPDDERQFASAVSSLLDDPEMARRMGVRARAHATSAYAVERLVADHDRLYRRLLVSTGRPRTGNGTTPFRQGRRCV